MAEPVQAPAPEGINAENNHMAGDPIVNNNRPRNNNANNANQQQPVSKFCIFTFIFFFCVYQTAMTYIFIFNINNYFLESTYKH